MFKKTSYFDYVSLKWLHSHVWAKTFITNCNYYKLHLIVVKWVIPMLPSCCGHFETNVHFERRQSDGFFIHT